VPIDSADRTRNRKLTVVDALPSLHASAFPRTRDPHLPLYFQGRPAMAVFGQVVVSAGSRSSRDRSRCSPRIPGRVSPRAGGVEAPRRRVTFFWGPSDRRPMGCCRTLGGGPGRGVFIVGIGRSQGRPCRTPKRLSDQASRRAGSCAMRSYATKRRRTQAPLVGWLRTPRPSDLPVVLHRETRSA
jgi:hypothetical protein